jgi:hypothetical protein
VDGGLPEAVAAVLHAPAMVAYQDALAAAFTAGADARRRAKEVASRALEEGAGRVQLYQKGVELLQVGQPGGQAGRGWAPGTPGSCSMNTIAGQ